MTTSPSADRSRPRNRVTRLVAAILDGDDHADDLLHRLAYGLVSTNDAEALEAQNALRAIEGLRPDETREAALADQARPAWVIALTDQLRARWDQEHVWGMPK